MKDLRYLTDSYDKGIKRILEIDAPLNFIFMTDQHNGMNEMDARGKNPGNPGSYELASDAIDSMQYILDRCPNISMAICGGDIGDDYHPDIKKVREYHRDVMDAFYRLSVPTHCCLGSHDDAIGVAYDRGWDTRVHVIPPEELHEICMKYNPTPENYYYVDVDTSEGGYRMIFMNTSDKPYCEDVTGRCPYGWRQEISEKQIQWLEEDALQTDRWILLFGHAPIHNGKLFGTGGPPTYMTPTSDVVNGSRVYQAVKQRKNVIATFFGHLHYDNLYSDDDLLTVTTLCSLVQEGVPGRPKRTYGTPTETAFDVFSIKDGVLYATRFGAGEDRCITLPRMSL